MLIGLEFRRGCGRIFVDDAGRRLCPAKLARERIDSQRSDLFEFFLALFKLVARLKFQSVKILSEGLKSISVRAYTGQESAAAEAGRSPTSIASRYQGTSINSAQKVSLLFS